MPFLPFAHANASSYGLNFYYWEVVDVYRRIVLVGVLPLVSARPARVAASGLILGFIGLVSCVSTRER